MLVRPIDLLGVVERGASLRRRRFLRDLRLTALPVLIGAASQVLIYAAVILRAGREDWQNIAIVAAVLALVPLFSTILMISLRRQTFPITTAAFVTIILSNFAVAALSALRIPVSYTGILLGGPVALFCVVYASVKLQSAHDEQVAILDFPMAEDLSRQLGDTAEVVYGPLDNLDNIDRVLIDGQAHHTPKWSAFLTRLHMLGIEVTPWIRFLETRFGRVDVNSFDISHMSYSPSQVYYSKFKRSIDLVAVIVTAPLAVPVCLLIAAYIWMLDGGPVLFRQVRRGYGGGEFTMLKFRTMVRDAEGHSAQENDSRVIRGCHFLRQTRLDELPQIINILRGEMSWIGPRPVAVPIAEALEAQLPQYAHRHLVLPGLTGWAQVSQGYASTHHEEIEKLAYDLYYVKQLSFDIDLLIIAKTVQIVLMRSGAK